MKKVIIIVLVVILVLGVILVGTGLIITKGDFSLIFKSDVRTEANVDETQEVNAITMDLTSADNIEFYASEDTNLHINYWDSKKNPITYTYSNGNATLKQANNFLSWCNWDLNDNKMIKVYVPASVNNTVSIDLSAGSFTNKDCVLNVNTLKIDLSSGELDVNDITAKTVNLNASSGKINMDNINTEEFGIDISSGKFTLSNSIISGTLRLDLSSGNVNLNNVTTNRLQSNLSSGNVIAKGLISKTVHTDTSSGNVELHIIGNPSDYSIKIDVSVGTTVIEGEGVSIKNTSHIEWGTGTNKIDCESSSGDIKIYFE